MATQDKTYTRDQFAKALLNASIPFGTKRYSREVREKAVRLVMIEGWSYRRAGREVGVRHESVSDWVAETEERMRLSGIDLPWARAKPRKGEPVAESSAA